MDPKEALRLLDNVAAKYNGTRQDHKLLEEAIAVLDKAIEKPFQSGV